MFMLSCHPRCQEGREILTWYPGGPLRFHTENSDVLKTLQKSPLSGLKAFFSEIDYSKITDDQLDDIAKKVMLPREECKFWMDHLQTIVDNCLRGARKAAETRKLRKSAASVAARASQSSDALSSERESVFCGTCGDEYLEESTEEPEVWIGSDLCLNWYHLSCENLQSPPSAETYICIKCQ